jgi:hypothetical protein
MHPTEVKNAVELADQMIGWHHLVEIKGIKELALPVLPPSHHPPLPPMTDSSIKRNHGATIVSMGLLQQNRGKSGLDLLTLMISAFDAVDDTHAAGIDVPKGGCVEANH